MRILKGKDHSGTIDDRTRTIRIKNKTIDIPPNLVVSAGDRIVLKGEEYDVLDYNPSWFSDVARRGAQIIQPKDASYILERTGLRYGSRVLEAGVGSGALTSAILWIIGKEGHLHSIDTDEGAIARARENVSLFQEHSNWDVVHGDIREMKVPVGLDCAILDMPDPWNAICNVSPSVKNGGYLVTYSPTFNQTEKTVIEMENCNVSVVETVELIKRNILVRPDATRPDHQMLGHTAFITFGVKLSSHSIEL